MNYNERKGFTLIELLAVIVILAIIALIATPLIMNVIDDAKKESFKSTAYGIIEAAELEYASNKLKGIDGILTYTYEDGTENASVGGNLQYKGTKPKSGEVKIDKKGKIALAIHDGTYCAKKDYNVDQVTVTKKNASQCNLLPEGYDIAEDSDFEYIINVDAPNAYENGVNGYYHYIGNSEFVIIPAKIRGNEIRDYYRMFDGTYVKGVYSDNPNITSMAFMFDGNYATSLDLRYLDTSSVTDMTGMFRFSKATTINLSNFDTSNVTDMRSMFSGSDATELDLSSFNTSKVTDMSGMFYSSKATKLNLKSFNTSNVTTMASMFNSSKAKQLDLSSFVTSKVTDMSLMFYSVNVIQSTDLPQFDISNFDTSNVTDMSGMFYKFYVNSNFFDITHFNTSNVTNMSYMFRQFQLYELDLTNFDFSNVTDEYLADMFYESNTRYVYVSNQAIANRINSVCYGAFRDLEAVVR